MPWPRPTDSADRGEPEWINGSIGAVIHHGGALVGAVSFCVTDEGISHVYAISNPQKLARLDTAAQLTRS